MPIYSLERARYFCKAAGLLESEAYNSSDAQIAIIYISKVSCELALKALLEKAGKRVSEIRKCEHNLSRLLDKFCSCEIQKQLTARQKGWVSAIFLRGEVVDDRYQNATVGAILDSEKNGGSKFPNEIRYGDNVRDYHSSLLVKTADKILAWADTHWNEIRLRPETDKP